MKVALVGGTRGIGRALARLLAAQGAMVCLLGRNPDELARSAVDLAAREGGEPLPFAHLDLEDPATFEPALELADEALGGFDALVVTAAAFATQERLEDDPELLRRLLTVDFAHTVLLCELARPRLLERRGTLCVFSSVAGDRGRSPVALYGAAKAGLSTYLEALDHRWHREGLRVLCVKPGFVRTGMTRGLPEPPFAGEPEQVARDVLQALERRRPVVYSPAVWRLVMGVVRRLPRGVMRRVSF